jgi:hypothetical protein
VATLNTDEAKVSKDKEKTKAVIQREEAQHTEQV